MLHCCPAALQEDHSATEEYSQVLRLMEFTLLVLGLAWDLSLLSHFQFLHFGVGLSNPCLSYHCILEVHSLSGFTCSQLERNFA